MSRLVELHSSAHAGDLSGTEPRSLNCVPAVGGDWTRNSGVRERAPLRPVAGLASENGRARSSA